jgi:molybdate transport system substrate-binding protein
VTATGFSILIRLIALLLFLAANPVQADDTLRIAVAANFRHVLEQASDAFQEQTGQRVVLSSASTGVLYTQIKYGAPFDLYFAADRATPGKLATASRSSFCYARGRLVLAGGSGGLEAMADPGLSLAIANPALAPYGSAALEVLEREEFQAGKPRKLLTGSNVIQAYQFWYSGGADLALVPRSLAPQGTPIPADWHQPIEQHAIALRQGAAVEAYLNWINSDTVQALIQNAGYEPCP